MILRKALLIITSLCSLPLSSCAPRIQKPEPMQQSAAVQFDAAKLEQIISKQKAKLPTEIFNIDSYIIWKDNPSFVGYQGIKDHIIHYSYTDFYRQVSTQDIYKLRLAIIAQFGKSDFKLEKIEKALPFGYSMLVRTVLTEAGKQHLMPEISGVGYSLDAPTIIVNIENRANIPGIQKVLDYMKVPPEIVLFDDTKFILL